MQTTYGFGCLGTIGVVLVILRAFRLITWSWWIVTAPLWGPSAFLLAAFAVMGMLSLPKDWIKKKREKKEGK